MMGKLGIFVTCIFLISCQSPPPDLIHSKIVDLTYSFDDQTIYWPNAEGFILEHVFKGKTDQGYFYASNNFGSGEHGGTHVDAPIHFYQEGRTVDQIPLEQLIGPALLIDVSSRALQNPDYQVTAEDLKDWEKDNGRIPENAILLIKTGYGQYWPDREKYLGTDQRGKKAIKKLRFPGLHPMGARWLVQNRLIKAVGIDTASIDFGQSSAFLTHQILNKQNIPILENVANLDKLPIRGFTLIALPMKIAEGTGAPSRIIAILPVTR